MGKPRVSHSDDYEQQMEKMFAAVGDLYARYWNDFFHFAIFRGDESWETAFAETHAKYLRALRIAESKNILELSCGRGAFSNLMAQSTSGTVLGVDISQAQLAHAKRFRRPNLEFRRHDVMKIDGLDDTFDAIAYIDAACYLPRKSEAVRKISKILKPGGRLLLVDWCKAEGVNPVQDELVLHPFMKYWAISNLETAGNYEKYFRENDLKIVETEDLNAKTRKNWDFGYEKALEAVRELSPKDLPRLLYTRIKLGGEGIKLIKDQFPAALYIKAAFDLGLLRYTYFVLEKDPAISGALQDHGSVDAAEAR